MLVTVSFDKNDEQSITDVMLINQRNYDMFCSGTVESIASNCGVSCSTCKERMQETPGSENNNELLLVYALGNKAATMELLCNLAETGVTKVQTTPSLISFFETAKPLCTKCKGKESPVAKQKPSTSKSVKIKKEPSLTIKRIKIETEETQMAETVVSTPTTTNDSYESDAEEEFLTIYEPTEETLASQADALPAEIVSDQTPVITTQRVVAYKPETRQGRSFVENQERSQNEQLMTPGTVEDENDENVASKEVSEVSTPCNRNRLIVGANSEGVQKGEEECKICKKTLRVASGRDYNTNMSFSMQSHSRVHVDIFPFKCRTCGYECRFGSMMRTHCRKRHASVKPTFIDNTSDTAYSEEIIAMAKQCFPDWVPTNRRESLGKGTKRRHE